MLIFILDADMTQGALAPMRHMRMGVIGGGARTCKPLSNNARNNTMNNEPTPAPQATAGAPNIPSGASVAILANPPREKNQKFDQWGSKK